MQPSSLVEGAREEADSRVAGEEEEEGGLREEEEGAGVG